jgi:tetratricopeptide (TPR) repeat protein
MRSLGEAVSLRRATWVFVLLLSLSAVHGVRAESPSAKARDEQARTLFFAGLEHSKNEQWDEAAASFRESLALVERPSTLQNLVAALQRLGHYGEAIAAIDRFLTISEGKENARTRAELSALRPTLAAQQGSLTLRVDPNDAQVQLNGRLLPVSGEYKLELDPGLYVIEAQAPGRVPDTRELRVEKGEAHVHTIALSVLPANVGEVESPEPFVQTAPASAPLRSERRSLRPWVWATASSAALTLGLGAFTWSQAAKYNKQLEGDCKIKDQCEDPHLEAHKQRIERYKHSTWALFAVAGVSALTSATLLWLDLKGQRKDLSVGLSLQGATLRGRF